MGKEVLTFGNAEIEKKIFTAIKENLDIQKVLVFISDFF